MMTTTPMLSPVLPATPWWKTSHGSRPSPARMNIAREIPYMARPIKSWRSLRGNMLPSMPKNWP
jgi:hypothetical protein